MGSAQHLAADTMNSWARYQQNLAVPAQLLARKCLVLRAVPHVTVHQQQPCSRLAVWVAEQVMKQRSACNTYLVGG